MRQLIAILVSLAILALLWRQIDVRAILAAIRMANPVWLTAGLLLVIPLTVVTAQRFSLLTRTGFPMRSAIRLILSASTLNLILPSKMGDIAKGWVLHSRYGFDGERALALVIFEKLIDLASLLFWALLALLLLHLPGMLAATVLTSAALAALMAILAPWTMTGRLIDGASRLLPRRVGVRLGRFNAQWLEISSWFWKRGGGSHVVWFVSLALWAGHLVQIWLFANALHAGVPLLHSMAFAALAILAGLLPLTLAGIGTRDAALVVLFTGLLTPAQGAALGLFATMRYFLPAVAGLPFMGDYWRIRKEMKTDAKPIHAEP